MVVLYKDIAALTTKLTCGMIDFNFRSPFSQGQSVDVEIYKGNNNNEPATDTKFGEGGYCVFEIFTEIWQSCE